MPVFDIHSWLGGSIVPGMAQNVEALTSAMQDAGIDRAVIMSAHARLVDPLAGNRLAGAAVERAPNLYACLVGHVNRPESSLNAMRELMPRRRFVALAVLGRSWHEPVSRAQADELLNAYRRYTKPIMVCALDADGVHAALDIARAYPMLRVVMLGMGGRDWRDAVRAAHTATNIILETSGALECPKLVSAVETIGAHRIVFGSWSPHTAAPAAIGMIEDAPISDDAKRRIFWDNAIRLFDLESPPASDEQ
ncbi:MAG: amidohydrolase family protein [Chthonomonadales bacterium]|nr:amidohydrolase family protein [Chthonomonadales bacterium]